MEPYFSCTESSENQLQQETYKVRSPIPWVFGGFSTMYYKDVGELQILYSQDICW
jgi:hypothetical protein